MNLKVLLIIFLSISHARSMESYKICDLIKDAVKLRCYVDENGFMVDLDYATQLNVVRSERNLQLICHQKREVPNSLLEKFPQLNLSEIKKLNLSGCVLMENSFMKIFVDRLNLTQIEEAEFDLKKKDDKAITSEIFEGLETVKKMKLKTHQAHTFHSDSFKKLENLRHLSWLVYDVMEPPIPANIFLNVMPKLEFLSIVNTADRKKDKENNLTLIFDDIMNLRNFSIQGIRMPFELKIKLPKIVNNVKIANNFHMTKLGESELRRNDQIEDLNLSNNKLEEIHPKAFTELMSLQRLDLSYNKISNMSEELFAKNINLEYLDLSNNELKVIVNNIFTSLINLKILKLDSNYIENITLPTTFNGTTELEILSLRANKIRKFFHEMPDSKLKELDLTYNNISRFFLANFLNSTKSFHLNIQLGHNPLESVDFTRVEEKLSANRQTIKIDVGLDPIKCDCQTLSLYEFYNRKNFVNEKLYERIKIIPNDIECQHAPIHVKDIKTEEMICSIDDDHQNLCPTSCHCRNKAITKTLEIRCFNITKVPDLPPYYYLKEIVTSTILFLKGNGLTSLPMKSCQTYNQVVEIDASFNSINQLSVENIPDALEYLDLHHNNLKTLSIEVILRFSGLSRLQISANPWNCTKSHDLVIFAKNNREIVQDLNQIRCHNDGRYFLEIDYSSQCGTLIIMFVTILLLTISCGTVFFLYHKYRRALTEWIVIRDKYHVYETCVDVVLLKKFDICFVMSSYDNVMVKYIAEKLKRIPNEFKCAFVTKNWSADESIPLNVMHTLRKSRRVAIILSEYFEEDNWSQWSYSNIYARLIIIEKGAMNSNKINLKNKMAVKFNDPWFHEKLKFIITHRHEMEVESDESDNNIEMQPLNLV